MDILTEVLKGERQDGKHQFHSGSKPRCPLVGGVTILLSLSRGLLTSAYTALDTKNELHSPLVVQNSHCCPKISTDSQLRGFRQTFSGTALYTMVSMGLVLQSPPRIAICPYNSYIQSYRFFHNLSRVNIRSKSRNWDHSVQRWHMDVV